MRMASMHVAFVVASDRRWRYIVCGSADSGDRPMTAEATPTFDGGCTCGAVRYRLTQAPLFVHCCHCRWCQRETGSAFVLNALIESSCVTLLQGSPEAVPTPSNSGKGQTILRCPQCHVAVWSHYAGGGTAFTFVRVGTLDDPDRCPPDVHIYTLSKQPWVLLPPDTPAFAEYYDRDRCWPPASLARRQAVLDAQSRS
jgi:hypothetical protein